jgi:hypothetical protein
MKAQDISISGFDLLHAAVIDSSSIIYLHKINLLDLAADNIELHTPEIVINETGLRNPDIIVHLPETDSSMLSADQQVVYFAVKKNLPVISEDKKVLSEASKASIPYYNTLMILNYLLYKKRIIPDQYDHFHKELLSVSRYSPFVLAYGEIVKDKVIEKVRQ